MPVRHATVDAEHRGAGEGTTEDRREPPIALDDAMTRVAHDLCEHGREHDFIADALFTAEQDGLPGERFSLPARLRKPSHRLVAQRADPTRGIARPAFRELSIPEQ